MQETIGPIHSNLNGFNALAALSENANELFADNLELDFQPCTFFDANMAAPFHAVLTKLNRMSDISITNMHPGIQTILQKNHFLCEFGYDELPDTNQTTIPFSRFNVNDGRLFNEYIERYMRGRGIPLMTPQLRKKFLQSLHEIFQNVSDHAYSSAGIFVCGQFFPNKHRLDFAIADTGIGIRENVRRFLKNKRINSCQAITWATDGTNSTKHNKVGGLGLKLIKNFIRLNKGKIQIASRRGFYQFSASRETCEMLEHDFPGTCVNIEINTNDTKNYALKSELKSSDIF